MNTWIERLWGSQSQQPFYTTEMGCLWPRVWLKVGRWCAIYFLTSLSSLPLTFPLLGIRPRAARVRMQLWGTAHTRAFSDAGEIPQWPGEAAASLEPHGLVAPRTPVWKRVTVSGIISLLVTLVSPWRRNASSGQNLSDFAQPDGPSGGVLRLVPIRSSTEQSPSLFLLRTAETD